MPDTVLSALPFAPALTTTDQVFRSLYGAVISLQLPPGTKVSEVEVAKQFDVSRQPVRDAFFRLSKLGFLAIRPQRATLVTRISARAVMDAVFVRNALESECVMRACRQRSDRDLADLNDGIARQRLALGAANAGEFHALDDAFHLCLCRIAGHAHVWDIIQEQKAHMDRVRYLTLSEERRRSVIAEHEAIVAAIETQDDAAARRLVRDHIGGINTVLARIRAEHEDYFED